MPKPQAHCRECGETFDLPAVAKCVVCGGRYLDRVEPNLDARTIKALLLDARRKEDDDLADALQRVLDLYERPSVMMQAFGVLAVRP
jgi:hypothetical protein